MGFTFEDIITLTFGIATTMHDEELKKQGEQLFRMCHSLDASPLVIVHLVV